MRLQLLEQLGLFARVLVFGEQTGRDAIQNVIAHWPSSLFGRQPAETPVLLRGNIANFFFAAMAGSVRHGFPFSESDRGRAKLGAAARIDSKIYINISWL